MPLLGYWKIRGLAQSIRLMLGYAEVDFEDKLYEITDPPEFSPEAWMKDKFTLGMEHAQLLMEFKLPAGLSLSKSAFGIRFLASLYP